MLTKLFKDVFDSAKYEDATNNKVAKSSIKGDGRFLTSSTKKFSIMFVNLVTTDISLQISFPNYKGPKRKISKILFLKNYRPLSSSSTRTTSNFSSKFCLACVNKCRVFQADFISLLELEKSVQSINKFRPLKLPASMSQYMLASFMVIWLCEILKMNTKLYVSKPIIRFGGKGRNNPKREKKKKIISSEVENVKTETITNYKQVYTSNSG